MALAADDTAGASVTLQVDIQAALGDLALDVTFEAAPGVTVLFGPSGAGKTSVINAVAGLLTPDTGRIVLGDRVLFGAEVNMPVHDRNVGYVFQDARLFPHMSVRQNLTYGGDRDFDRLVDLLGLAPLLQRRSVGLSGGEKQRVALGRALMRGPDVLLMDEPLAALDGPRKAELLPYLQGLGAEAGVPILYVTHAMAEVAQLADQLVVLDKGRVARNGPVADVLADPMAAQYFAKRDAGALLHCTVARHEGGLTVLDTAAGEVLLPGTLGAVGSVLRLSIPAQDVILSRQPLEGQSALNMLQVAVATLRDLPNGNVAVVLRAGDAQIWAELTPVSVTRLGLAAGQDVYAVFKATAVGPG